MTDAPGIYDLLIEMRKDLSTRLQTIEHILTGDGQPGLCEIVRRNTLDISHFMTLADSLTASIGELSKNQTLHQDWHAKPENYTIQEMFRHRGFLAFVAIILLIFAIIGGTVTGVDLLTFLKGLLT